jgi:hypothetical protein
MEGRRPRVFVSHSSQTSDALTELKALVAGLRAGEDGVEVLYDEEHIETGAQWRAAINALLAECDAAIILLTPDALTSTWVLKEATILRWRHDRDPNFKILVSANVDIAKLEENSLWNPIGLHELQSLPSGSAAENAVAAKESLTGLAAQLRPTPLGLLAVAIASLLTNADPEFLQHVLGPLHEEVPFEIGDQHKRLAYALARWILRQPPPALNHMADRLANLGPGFPPENTRKILDIVSSMWVELDAASWFVRANLQRGLGLRDVAISCKRPTPTLQQYVARAYMPSYPPRVRLLNGVTGGKQAEDLAHQVREELRHDLEDVLGPLSDAEIDDRLSQIETRYYVALQLPDDRQVVTTLQEQYPRVTFVFFVDPTKYSPDETTPVAPGVRWVAPKLNTILEENAATDYISARARF